MVVVDDEVFEMGRRSVVGAWEAGDEISRAVASLF